MQLGVYTLACHEYIYNCDKINEIWLLQHKIMNKYSSYSLRSVNILVTH